MSVDIRSLLRQAQSGAIEPNAQTASNPPQEQPVPEGEGERSEPEKRSGTKAPKKRHGVKTGLVDRIRAVGDSEEPYGHSVHIRLKKSTHQKMLICGLGGIRIQELAAFAIDQLMESGEMVELINRVKNDMD